MRNGKAALAVVIAGLSLLMACSRSTSGPGGTDGGIARFLAVDLKVSFAVPSAWAEPKSLKRNTYAARFDSPDGAASVTLGRAPFVGSSCPAAAKAALETASGSDLEVQNEFDLKVAQESFKAGAGSTSSKEREGVARYFCRGKYAVIVEAAAAGPSLQRGIRSCGRSSTRWRSTT